jgi:hypothetical protein
MSLNSGYRVWHRRLQPVWMASLPIAWTGVRLVLRRKLFWLLLGLALMNFLFLFATIYLKAQIAVENPMIARFADRVLSGVTEDGRTYLMFMFGQGTVTMLLLALAGELLIGSDYYEGGLTFYLSRRIGRGHYVAGKLLASAMLVSLTTTIPALILFAEYGLLTNSLAYFRENLRILGGIVGYGAIMAVAVSLLLFALASWLQRTVPLVMSWACVFVLLPALGEVFRHVFGSRMWRLLSFWRDLRLLGSWCFGGSSQHDMEHVGWAALIVIAVCIVCLLVSLPRVRAVRVIG